MLFGLDMIEFISGGLDSLLVDGMEVLILVEFNFAELAKFFLGPFDLLLELLKVEKLLLEIAGGNGFGPCHEKNIMLTTIYNNHISKHTQHNK